MGGKGSGRKRKVGRPRIHAKGWKGHTNAGRPRKRGRPKGIHTKWGQKSKKLTPSQRRKLIMRYS